MTIIKTKPRRVQKPLPLISFRVQEETNARLERAFNALQIAQGGIKKPDLYRDAIERGLSEIEKQLEAVE